MSDHNEEHRPVRRALWARLLLILPFISMLWVSSYSATALTRMRWPATSRARPLVMTSIAPLVAA